MKPLNHTAFANSDDDLPLNVELADQLPTGRGDEARVLTIYRVARATTERDTGLCRVQSISNEGVTAVTCLAVAAGDAIAVSLSETVSLSGEVTWTDGARVGIRFREQIDCAALLKYLAAERSAGDQRPTRLPIDIVGVATTSAGLQSVRVIDISQVGMKLRHNGGLSVGHTVTVVLENGLRRRGVIRWSDQGLAGLRLLEPIACRQLESAVSL